VWRIAAQRGQQRRRVIGPEFGKRRVIHRLHLEESEFFGILAAGWSISHVITIQHQTRPEPLGLQPIQRIQQRSIGQADPWPAQHEKAAPVPQGNGEVGGHQLADDFSLSGHRARSQGRRASQSPPSSSGRT
jgi:hypothetical protein